ncbi:MAG: hypothetical protein EOP49_13900 [Sphingobacteriales bacterium]|nr:MAG: hypothetical protein EOP49_13900 [Sphingobacteriales bacterium]
MDVAKYIGLFLLKNNFVYIHGLGNLELKKRPATYEGEALKPPTYEVQLTPSGSIDDNLANFIANNEQISISKASNALREFSIQAKTELQSGKPVEIPSIGKFIETNGRIGFVTNPGFQFTPPSIPTIKVARKQAEPVFGQPYNVGTRPAQPAASMDPGPDEPEAEKTGSINWLRVGIAAGVLLLLILAIFTIVKYMGNNNATKEAPLMPPASTQEEQVMEPVAVDSNAAVTDSIPAELLSFEVKLHTYTDQAKAVARLTQLKGLGKTVMMQPAEDDTNVYYLLMPIENISPADTTALLDSLRRNYNPKRGVSIYKFTN